jgi:hypothetical protein
MYFFKSATNFHCRTLPGISFLLNLPEWVYGYISRFSCAKQIDNISSGEPFPWHRNSSPRCTKREEKSECMYRWTRWTFPTLNITLFSDFNVIYFLTNITCVMNGLSDFSITVLVARHLRASLTVTNTQVGGQPGEVRGGRGSDSAQGVLLPPWPFHLLFPHLLWRSSSSHTFCIQYTRLIYWGSRNIEPVDVAVKIWLAF